MSNYACTCLCFIRKKRVCWHLHTVLSEQESFTHLVKNLIYRSGLAVLSKDMMILPIITIDDNIETLNELSGSINGDMIVSESQFAGAVPQIIETGSADQELKHSEGSFPSYSLNESSLRNITPIGNVIGYENPHSNSLL